MGSIKRIERSGKVLFEAVVDLGKSADGKRRQRSKSFHSEREAKKALAAWEHDINQGLAVDTSATTVAALLDAWLLMGQRHNLAPSTLDSYTRTANNHIKPRIGAVKAQKLTGAMLDTMYAEAQAAGVGANTLEKVHFIMRSTLTLGVKHREVARNVAEDATPVRRVKQDMKVWTAAQAQQFLAVANTHMYGPIWLLALSTGLRRGELLGLRWTDINLTEGYLTVKQGLTRINSTVHFGPPKTRASRRTVYLEPEAIDALHAHKAEQARRRLLVGTEWWSGWQANPLVFTTGMGNPLIPSNVVKAHIRIVKAAGVPYIRIHDLRHTFATLGLAAGGHLKAVSESLGHTKASFTIDTYAHVLPQQRAEVAAKVGAALFSRVV